MRILIGRLLVENQGNLYDVAHLLPVHKILVINFCMNGKDVAVNNDIAVDF